MSRIDDFIAWLRDYMLPYAEGVNREAPPSLVIEALIKEMENGISLLKGEEDGTIRSNQTR